MAYDDTLFQLGMDLTRSSTAQKEEIHETAQFAQTEPKFGSLERDTPLTTAAAPTPFNSVKTELSEERLDFFIEQDGVRYAGNHLIIDLFGASRVDDVVHVERAMRRCVKEAGATLLNIDLHHFTPNGGVSGVAVLSESHISVHSWPEANYAAFDVFMCGHAKPQLCVEILREEFSARDVVVKVHRRGEDLDLMAWQAGSGKKAAKAA